MTLLRLVGGPLAGRMNIDGYRDYHSGASKALYVIPTSIYLGTYICIVYMCARSLCGKLVSTYIYSCRPGKYR